MVVRVNGMEFYYYSPSETFAVLTTDEFVGRDDGLFNNRSRIATFVEEMAHFL